VSSDTIFAKDFIITEIFNPHDHVALMFQVKNNSCMNSFWQCTAADDAELLSVMIYCTVLHYAQWTRVLGVLFTDMFWSLNIHGYFAKLFGRSIG
jgi:hypothetical protein